MLDSFTQFMCSVELLYAKQSFEKLPKELQECIVEELFKPLYTNEEFVEKLKGAFLFDEKSLTPIKNALRNFDKKVAEILKQKGVSKYDFAYHIFDTNPSSHIYHGYAGDIKSTLSSITKRINSFIRSYTKTKSRELLHLILTLRYHKLFYPGVVQFQIKIYPVELF